MSGVGNQDLKGVRTGGREFHLQQNAGVVRASYNGPHILLCVTRRVCL